MKKLNFSSSALQLEVAAELLGAELEPDLAELPPLALPVFTLDAPPVAFELLASELVPPAALVVVLFALDPPLALALLLLELLPPRVAAPLVSLSLELPPWVCSSESDAPPLFAFA